MHVEYQKSQTSSGRTWNVMLKLYARTEYLDYFLVIFHSEGETTTNNLHLLSHIL